MELLIIRHARPERVELETGRADPPLTPEGEAQAIALAKWLATESLDAVYSSPLQRARQTAAPVADQHGLDVLIEPTVAEFDRDASAYIPIEEMTNAEVAEMVQGQGFSWSANPEDFRASAVAGIEAIIDANPSRRVAVVCHGGVINSYVGHILGIPQLLWFAPSYTSIARVLASSQGHRQINTLNERAHLDGV